MYTVSLPAIWLWEREKSITFGVATLGKQMEGNREKVLQLKKGNARGRRQPADEPLPASDAQRFQNHNLTFPPLPWKGVWHSSIFPHSCPGGLVCMSSFVLFLSFTTFHAEAFCSVKDKPVSRPGFYMRARWWRALTERTRMHNKGSCILPNVFFFKKKKFEAPWDPAWL